MSIIQLNNVSFRYRGDSEWTLKSVTLEINEGKYLVVGPTGSGKTTLLRIIAGLIPKVYQGELSGEIKVSGKAVLVPQLFDLFILMPTVREELAYCYEIGNTERGKIGSEMLYLTKKLGIEHLLDREISKLSMGERQKVAIASALAIGAEIIMLDEPLAYLDPAAVHEFLSFLNTISAKVIIMAEHRTKYLEGWYHKLIFLKNGTVFPVRTISEAEEIMENF
ncbi:MAG: ABC transporter ATP-binding protein [Fervidicoccaceae archaeon]